MKTMKLNIVMLMTTLMVLLGATSSFALSKDGDGVFQIGTCKDLLDFADTVTKNANYTANAVLTAHINMNDEYTSGKTCNERPFAGIGDSSASGTNTYKGSFDGKGYVISNMVFDDKGSIFYQNMGLFASLQYPGIIKNVILENVSLVSSGTNSSSRDTPASVGSLVGWMRSGFIENCYVTGSITSSGKKNGVGGLVGYMDGGLIKDCLSSVSIHATGGDSTSVGGIAGYAVKGVGKSDNPDQESSIETCVYNGTSLKNEGLGFVGGVVGNSLGATGSGTQGSFTNNYYNSNALDSASGVGLGGTTTLESNAGGRENLNTADVICSLNGGTWEDPVCTGGSDTWGMGTSITNGGVSSNKLGNVVYTVSFDPNGGSFPAGAKTSKYLEVGSVITADEITNPTREGYTFGGWSYASNAESPDANLGSVTQAVTIYAVWYEQIEVTFVANTGNLANAQFSDNTTSKSKKVDYGSVITSDKIGNPVDFTVGEGESKVYYTFMGWSLSPSAENPDVDPVVAEYDTTLYAVWHLTQSVFYTVTFNANNHGDAPQSLRVESGHNAVKPSDPSAVGYEFKGWFYNSYGTGSEFNFDATAVSGDLTLYAKWSAITYAIRYHDVIAGNNTVNPTEYTADSDIITLQKPDSTGYDFLGWFYDEALTNPATTIAAGSTGDKDFYAKWSKKTYTISFLSGGNSKGSMASIVKEYGVDVELPTATFTSNNNYPQSGWSYSDGGEKAFELGATYDLNQDATLYPYWNTTAKHSINYAVGYYDAAGNKLLDSTKFSEVDLDYNTHTLATPAAVTGYTFDGWDKVVRYDTTTTGLGTKKTTTITESNVSVTQGKFKMTNKDVYVYGKYVLDTYTITYNNLGSQTTGNNASEYTVRSAALDLAAPVGDSSKYAFVGWYDNANFSGEPVTTIAAGSTGDKTLYAKWRRVDYGSVKISADGLTVTVESDSKEPVELSEEGIEVENIVFERNGLEAGLFATVVLPFDLPEGTELNANYYYFYEMEDRGTKWFARFKNIGSGALPSADVPYVFILNSGESTLKFDMPTNTKAVVHSGNIQNKTSLSGDWTFNGTYSYKEWLAGDPELGLAYGFAAKNEENVSKGKFGKAGVGNFIYPTRAYLKKKDASVEHVTALGKPSPDGTVVRSSLTSLPAEIEAVFEDENDEVMAIGKYNTITGQVKIDRWIDLKGRQSNKHPSAKGVYFNKKIY